MMFNDFALMFNDLWSKLKPLSGFDHWCLENAALCQVSDQKDSDSTAFCVQNLVIAQVLVI